MYWFIKDLKSNTVISRRYRIQIRIEIEPVIIAISFGIIF